MPILVVKVPLAAVATCLLAVPPVIVIVAFASGPAAEYSLPLNWILPGIRPIAAHVQIQNRGCQGDVQNVACHHRRISAVCRHRNSDHMFTRRDCGSQRYPLIKNQRRVKLTLKRIVEVKLDSPLL